MQIIKLREAKYPIKAVLSTGEKIIIPKQSKFSNSWLKNHGCSIMAEYIALQFLGVKKLTINKNTYGVWPINLLKWHRKYTPNQVKSKVTVRGVARGINAIGKGVGKATYHRVVTAKGMSEALEAGRMVIMEQADPIHTIALLPDSEGVYMASYGRVKEVSVKAIAKTATTNATYRGMVIVKKGV